MKRKSVEPLAAHTDPEHVRAKHQSLHHFVANSEWSDQAVMDQAREWVLPALGFEDGCYWIVDDTGSPKNGTHSVGVARQYCGQLGIRPATTVWKPGVAPMSPLPWSGHGRKPTRLRCAPGHQPLAVKALAIALPKKVYRTLTWREGTHAKLNSRFAALRVRPAHADRQTGTPPRPEEWLLIEWPTGETEPTGYWLSTGPADATLRQLVFVAKMRWRIERDYRELKQEFGLNQYEGRNWRGFHHHATLCIAAYAFLTHQRLTMDSKKTLLNHQCLPYPKVTCLAAAGRTQRHVPDSITSLRTAIAKAIAKRLPRCSCCGVVRRD